MSFLRYGLGKFRCCIWKEKFASVYQSTLAWYGQVWCFRDESPKIHGRPNKFRGCPCTRVHQSRMTEQFTRAWMLLGGRVTVPRSRNFSDWSNWLKKLQTSVKNLKQKKRGIFCENFIKISKEKLVKCATEFARLQRVSIQSCTQNQPSPKVQSRSGDWI